MDQTKEEVKNSKGILNKIKFIKLNYSILNKLIVFIIIVVGVYYVTGVNDLTVKGFELQKLKQQVSKLTEENKSYELKALTLKSYNNLTEKVKDKKMVSLGTDVDYLVVKGSVVAKR
ncbi:MAG: hypothetical protein PHT51_03625 [Patescibacteria group bacterium]|nr:hypothetical protein [Patescibacteria group bacterium]MDD4610950.1 hypothetical protein [Patescibacteria group bacterium]